MVVKKKKEAKAKEGVKLLIFDMQGTVVENGVFPSPIRQTKQILGLFNEPFSDFVKEFEQIFMTKDYADYSEALEAIFKGLNVNPDEYNRRSKLVGLWNKNKLFSKPFDDVKDTLKELKKDYKLVLVANCDSGSKQIVDKFGLRELFDEVSLSCETGLLKSNPKLFESILEGFDVQPEDVIIIGDSIESDIDPAKEIGIKGILIDRRDRRKEYVPRILSLKELKDKLKEV